MAFGISTGASGFSSGVSVTGSTFSVNFSFATSGFSIDFSEPEEQEYSRAEMKEFFS
jgi:hypothetical protein